MIFFLNKVLAWNIIRAGITCKKIILLKSIESDIPLRKNTKIYKGTYFLKIWVYVFGFYERTESDKSEFATKFVGIIVTINFL